MFPICPQISFHHFSLPFQNTCSYVWLHNTFGNKQLIHRRVHHPAKPKPYSTRVNKCPSIASPLFPQKQYLFVYVVTHTKHNTQIHDCTFTILPYKTITKPPLVLPHSPSHHYHTRISFSSPFINKSPVRCHKCTSHSIVVAMIKGL